MWAILIQAMSEPIVYQVTAPADLEDTTELVSSWRRVQYHVDLPDPICDALDASGETWRPCIADGDVIPVEVAVDSSGAISSVHAAGRQDCLRRTLTGLHVPDAASAAARCELFVTRADGGRAWPLYTLR